MPYIESTSPLATANTNAPADGLNDQAYYYFLDLVIQNPGTYRIRVNFMGVDHSPESGPNGTNIVLQQLDSRRIIVENPGLPYARPSNHSKEKYYRKILTDTDGAECSFLKILREDGQDIPRPRRQNSNQASNSANNSNSG